MNEDNSTERRLFVKIRFNKDSRYVALAETVYFRNDMDVDFFMRWKWFFEYRAALLRVQNPRAFVELTHGSYVYVFPEDEYKEKVNNLLLAAKRNLTKFKRQIDEARNNWNEFFPIEDHPKWKKVQDKLQYYEERVKNLSDEYDTIKSR